MVFRFTLCDPNAYYNILYILYLLEWTPQLQLFYVRKDLSRAATIRGMLLLSAYYSIILASQADESKRSVSTVSTWRRMFSSYLSRQW